jgi:hypothetical protein
MYVISVTKFFECVCTFWSIVPLGGDSLSGRSRVGGVLIGNATVAVTVSLILGVSIPVIDSFFLLMSLHSCMTFSTRLRGLALRRTRHCIFEKIKLRGELALLEYPPFSALGITIGSSL